MFIYDLPVYTPVILCTLFTLLICRIISALFVMSHFLRFCHPLNILLSSSVRFYKHLCVIYDIASCHPMQQCFLFALVILCMSLSLFISLDTTCLSPSVHSCHLLYDTVIFYRLIYPLYVTFMSPTVCRCHPLYALVISYCV